MKKFFFPLLLLAYIGFLFKVLVFKDVPLIRLGGLLFNFGGTQEGIPNLIPFNTIWPYLKGEFGLLIGGLNIVGNIVFLIPLGFLLPKVFNKISRLQVFLIALFFCLFIEMIQDYFRIGIFDIDDVILNVLGVMIGYWITIYLPVIWKKLKSDSKWMIGVILLGAIGTSLSIYNLTESLKQPAVGPDGKMNTPTPDSIIDKTPGAEDPCRGTGGTGVIIVADTSMITIRRKDGTSAQVQLTDKTIIKTANGKIMASELSTGQHVTLVIDDTETAALVLVCLDKNLKSQ